MPFNETKRDYLNRMLTELALERSSFDGHWRELGDYILPVRPRFNVTDTNRGERKNTKINDNTASLAVRTLRSGMMGGVTSPARPWFKLTTSNEMMDEEELVKSWLHDVEVRINTVFTKSNLYNVLPIIYSDMSVFGTAAMIVEEDFDDVVRFSPLPIGSFYIANDGRRKVRVLIREFRMTLRQVVDKFAEFDRDGKPDISILSTTLQNHWNAGRREMWVDLCHAIYPNLEYRPNSLNNKYKRFSSDYYEKSSGREKADKDKFLRESGFDYFPVLAPRWEVTGEDVYGTNCPGIEALPDVKQVQVVEKRILQAVEKMINPPLQGRPSIRNVKTSILPGDLSYTMSTNPNDKGLVPIHETKFSIQEAELKQQQTRERILKAFYADLFLMLSNLDRRQITAREVDERHEEKLLALGPVLEQLNQDLLDPLIDVTFIIMNRFGLIPPAPEELQGLNLRVEFISIMAQAQKLIGIYGIERLVNFAGQVSQVDPNVLDKIDTLQLIDEYHRALGTPPRVVRSDEDVEEIQRIRAEQQQRQAQVEAMEKASNVAKNLGNADLENDSALKRLLQQAQAGSPVPEV